MTPAEINRRKEQSRKDKMNNRLERIKAAKILYAFKGQFLKKKP